MATWKELAVANLESAKKLRESDLHRSGVSRAYYAAYCALTGEMTPKHSREFTYQDNNPDHKQLMKLVRHNLKSGALSSNFRKNLATSLEQLKGLREIADYIPGITVGLSELEIAIHLAKGILKDLDLT